MFNQEPYKSARYLASQYHGTQMYGDVSYIRHIEDVFNVLVSFNVVDEIILVAALLHDTIEDTNLTYSEIKKRFGFDVAELVYAVSNELGRSRNERYYKTMPKIVQNKRAIILKLADRISNIKYSLETKNKEKFDMYKKEYSMFKDDLINYVNNIGKSMFEYLDTLIK